MWFFFPVSNKEPVGIDFNRTSKYYREEFFLSEIRLVNSEYNFD